MRPQRIDMVQRRMLILVRPTRRVIEQQSRRQILRRTKAVESGGLSCGVVPGNSERSSALKLLGRPNGRSTMTANRPELVGLSVLVLTLITTVSLAQNTSNPLLSGNTVNPVLSGNTVAPGREAPVSPSTPNLNLSTGTNPFTGLPCTGPPTTGSPTANLAFPSVYGPPPSSC